MHGPTDAAKDAIWFSTHLPAGDQPSSPLVNTVSRRCPAALCREDNTASPRAAALVDTVVVGTVPPWGGGSWWIIAGLPVRSARRRHAPLPPIAVRKGALGDTSSDASGRRGARSGNGVKGDGGAGDRNGGGMRGGWSVVSWTAPDRHLHQTRMHVSAAEGQAEWPGMPPRAGTGAARSRLLGDRRGRRGRPVLRIMPLSSAQAFRRELSGPLRRPSAGARRRRKG